MKELKDCKIWFCWNLVKRKEKLTKVPISAYGTATGTNEKYMHTWVTYNEAVKSAEERKYNGVGFVIPKGYFFLDVDNRAVDDPFVQLMLERFNSYAELSQSGNGIHIYGKCDISKIPIKDGKVDKRYYVKNPNNEVELYIGDLTNRFAVFTGNVVKDVPICECTDAVLTTLNHDMLRKKTFRYTPKMDCSETEFGIIHSLRKAKNGEKFSKLFDKGDISDFGSQSEADCSLCALIAFRAGNNPELIDSIFRKSALYREKWERDDYRESTIMAGIESCSGTFHKSVMPHPEYVGFCPNSGVPYVICPKLAKHIRDDLDYIFVRDNGKSGVIRYVYDNGCYRIYADEMFKGIIKKYITDYDETILKMSAVEEVYKQLTTDLDFTTQDELNSDEGIINFQNGILRLSDMTLLPHSPEMLSTVQLDANWSNTPLSTPKFDAFLNTLTDGDKEIQNLLFEFMGVCLSNIKGWRFKKALFLHGKGDTGKSQLKSLTERILGKGNYVGIDISEIEARFGTGSIYGKRLVGSSDMSFVSIDELKTFKKCTGGDSLYAEFKGQNGFEFRYDGMMWFCMNRLPKFGGDDGRWVYDRIIQVECKNIIPKEKQDKMLLDKMYAEREGIIYKCIMALKNVITNGYVFTEPNTVTKAREKYMCENSTVISFFNECIEKRIDKKENDRCTTSRIYNVYRAWCYDNNHNHAKTAKEFRASLADHLNTTVTDMIVRKNFGMTYRDYTLTEDAINIYRKAYGYDGGEFLS